MSSRVLGMFRHLWQKAAYNISALKDRLPLYLPRQEPFDVA